ncbi:MAG TPA: adenylate/guanylate cyclase domain-containing protein, partial [Thiotrichaceae bacterium]|nr:adenylate/guanylate cyclase domain-containing protein [Thiotrichaceae bacterium]
EKMSPQENFNFINAYLKEMGPIIREHNGFVDKYIGDAIMALFINANDALNASIAMLKQLEQFNKNQTQNSPLKIGIGLNTGKLMLGIIGEANRLQGTVIGDAVNLASRIETLTKTYESFLIMSQETLENLTHSEQYTIRFLDNIKVKGRTGNVNIFEVLDADPKAVLRSKTPIPLENQGNDVGAIPCGSPPCGCPLVVTPCGCPFSKQNKPLC